MLQRSYRWRRSLPNESSTARACSRQRHSTLASALARHRSDQAISNPVLYQRLVCPVDRFAELQQQRDDADRIEVIALGPAVQQTEAGVVSPADGRIPVVALETSLLVDNQHKEQALEVIDQIVATWPHLDIFVEVGLGPALEANLDLPQRHGHAARRVAAGRAVSCFPPVRPGPGRSPRHSSGSAV
jgi:hypothetical protein